MIMSVSRICYLLLLTRAATSTAFALDLPSKNGTSQGSAVNSITQFTDAPTAETRLLEPGPTEIPTPTEIPGPDDVGSIIVSLVPTITRPTTEHLEATATGFEEDERPRQPPFSRPHIEKPAEDWGDPTPLPTTTPFFRPRPIITLDDQIVLTPTPKTSIEIDGTTLLPGGETATIGNGRTKTSVHLDPTGRPIIAIGKSTSTHIPPVIIGDLPATPIPSGIVIDQQTLTEGGSPVTVGWEGRPTIVSIDPAGRTLVLTNGQTSTYQAPAETFVIGDKSATVVADEIEYSAGSSTLAIGRPITIGGVAITLITEADGATVLVAGDSTTTFAAAPTDDVISTIIVSGTTQYIIQSQTLAPGHPITIAGTPVAIATKSGSTILVVGDETVSIRGAYPTGGPVQTGEAEGDAASHMGSSLWSTLVLGIVAILGLG